MALLARGQHAWPAFGMALDPKEQGDPTAEVAGAEVGREGTGVASGGDYMAGSSVSLASLCPCSPVLSCHHHIGWAELEKTPGVPPALRQVWMGCLMCARGSVWGCGCELVCSCM